MLCSIMSLPTHFLLYGPAMVAPWRKVSNLCSTAHKHGSSTRYYTIPNDLRICWIAGCLPLTAMLKQRMEPWILVTRRRLETFLDDVVQNQLYSCLIPIFRIRFHVHALFQDYFKKTLLNAASLLYVSQDLWIQILWNWRNYVCLNTNSAD